MIITKITITTEYGAIDGKTQAKKVSFYNLDVIIAVGYRSELLTPKAHIRLLV